MMIAPSTRPPEGSFPGADARPPNPVLRGPILLAIHGGEESAASIRVAHRLATRLGVGLQVVTVVDLVLEYSGPDLMPAVARLDGSAGTVAQGEAVQHRLRETLGGQAQWALDVRSGRPAREITRAAREANATLVVVAAEPRRGIRHVVSGTRALQIVGRSPCPVVSVAPSFASLPATIVAPIDFSPSSIRAAQAALLLASDGARLILVHVPIPLHFERARRDAAGSLVGGDVSEHFRHVRDQLEPFGPAGLTIETRTLDGGVVSSVLALAESEQADLIAVGTHGHGVVERFFVGSVAAGLLHGAACSVVAAPPPPPAEFVRLELQMSGDASVENPAGWGEVLRAASLRNAGRRVQLEVDDPSIGAQVQAEGYLLRGIDYDHVDQRVEIMVEAGEGHLSRGITGVRSVGIVTDGAGIDRAIEIAHGSGHTLVRFED